MENDDIKRITRLTAILTHLQSKKTVKAVELADKYAVSIRTVYRDMKTLEKAGVPIISLPAKGYTLMDNYRLEPITFTENEALALITAEMIIKSNPDQSLAKAYSDAIIKIKSVLKNNTKEKVNLLAERIHYSKDDLNEKPSNTLQTIQISLTNYQVLNITYTDESNNLTVRDIEPFSILSTPEKWLLIAWCRLRNTFRMFRLDRINSILVTSEKFIPHNITVRQFFDEYH